jgi:hypothetical protein
MMTSITLIDDTTSNLLFIFPWTMELEDMGEAVQKHETLHSSTDRFYWVLLTCQRFSKTLLQEESLHSPLIR